MGRHVRREKTKDLGGDKMSFGHGWIIAGFAISVGVTVLLLFYLRRLVDGMAIRSAEGALEALLLCEELEGRTSQHPS